MRNVVPILASNAEIPNEGHLPFTNFESMTQGATVKPVPDFFDGAQPGDVDSRVKNALHRTIVPTKHANVLVAPNFFLEAKAPCGGADVALRQSCADAVHGVYSMHTLQNYGEEEPTYDGDAHAFSSTYHAGTLKLYTHHVTPPAAPGDRPEYHMVQLRAFALTNDRETFIQGTSAFRNARDLAKQHRDSLIRKANAKAQRDAETESCSASASEIQQDGGPSSDELVGFHDSITSQDLLSASLNELPYTFQDTNDKPRPRTIGEGPAVSQYLFPEEDEGDD
jgi:hypothetical protein